MTETFDQLEGDARVLDQAARIFRTQWPGRADVTGAVELGARDLHRRAREAYTMIGATHETSQEKE